VERLNLKVKSVVYLQRAIFTGTGAQLVKVHQCGYAREARAA
jgi:hypothetical protein